MASPTPTAPAPTVPALGPPTLNPRKNNTKLFADAPPEHLAFAQGEPITAAEIVAFLPNSFRSHDVAFRFASNGGSNTAIARMVNYYRAPPSVMKGSPANNSICKIIKKAMQDYAYDDPVLDDLGNPVRDPTTGKDKVKKVDWTYRRHRAENIKDTNGPWDHTNLELTGMTPDLGSKTVIHNVRFDSLTVGVRRYPSFRLGDGLNLAQCVHYAVINPQQNLLFPRDFTRLIDHLGRNTVQQLHHDDNVFARWNQGPPVLLAALIPSNLGQSVVPLTAAAATASSNLQPTAAVSMSLMPVGQPAPTMSAFQPAQPMQQTHPMPSFGLPFYNRPVVAGSATRQYPVASSVGTWTPTPQTRDIGYTPVYRPAVLGVTNAGVARSRRPARTSTPAHHADRVSQLLRMDPNLISVRGVNQYPAYPSTGSTGMLYPASSSAQRLQQPTAQGQASFDAGRGPRQVPQAPLLGMLSLGDIDRYQRDLDNGPPGTYAQVFGVDNSTFSSFSQPPAIPVLRAFRPPTDQQTQQQQRPDGHQPPADFDFAELNDEL